MFHIELHVRWNQLLLDGECNVIEGFWHIAPYAVLDHFQHILCCNHSKTPEDFMSEAQLHCLCSAVEPGIASCSYHTLPGCQHAQTCKKLEMTLGTDTFHIIDNV